VSAGDSFLAMFAVQYVCKNLIKYTRNLPIYRTNLT